MRPLSRSVDSAPNWEPGAWSLQSSNMFPGITMLWKTSRQRARSCRGNHDLHQWFSNGGPRTPGGPQGHFRGLQSPPRSSSRTLPPNSFLLFAKPCWKCEEVASLRDLYIKFLCVAHVLMLAFCTTRKLCKKARLANRWVTLGCKSKLFANIKCTSIKVRHKRRELNEYVGNSSCKCSLFDIMTRSTRSPWGRGVTRGGGASVQNTLGNILIALSPPFSLFRPYLYAKFIY